MQECIFYTALEVADMLGVSRGHAYKIVKELNMDLKKKGYIVVAGRIPKQYFKEKYYGL